MRMWHIDVPSALRSIVSRLIYFAYGSNMARARLGARIRDIRHAGLARLPAHRLSFEQRSEHDGSGKCDASATGHPDDHVIGVLWDIPAEEIHVLDGFEGPGYRRASIWLQREHSLVCAEIYLARERFSDVRPWHWYKHHVLAGARENQLPSDYIRAIEGIPARLDPDPERSDRELAIYPFNAAPA